VLTSVEVHPPDKHVGPRRSGQQLGGSGAVLHHRGQLYSRAELALPAVDDADGSAWRFAVVLAFRDAGAVMALVRQLEDIGADLMEPAEVCPCPVDDWSAEVRHRPPCPRAPAPAVPAAVEEEPPF